MGIKGDTPRQVSENKRPNAIKLNHFQWESHCRGLFQLPTAA